MLIPIGHEDQKVIRLPWVTIALIIANFALFLATYPLARQQANDTRLRFREVVLFARDHPYLRLPEELSRIIPARRPPANSSPDVLAEEQAKLDRLMNDFEATKSRSVFRTYGYIPAQPHLLALFTSMFMHGGWLHLLGNMLFLWVSGTSLEDRWGRVVFPALYLLSGAAGGITHAAIHRESLIPLIGASGAIAGLMGAFLIRLATTRIRFFYWIFLFRGTFYAPAYIVLPLWFLEQFAMASLGIAGGVAVWAHIGGFACGALAAILIRATDLEVSVLVPAIDKKTTWTPSDRLTAALGKLDREDTDGAIKDLETLLRARPDSLDARTSLITAYARKGDQAAAGRESARLVGGYIKARDMAGAMAAFREHWHAYPTVPLAMRDQLALATHCEKSQEYQEAADLFRDTIAAWPDDLLTPKALAGYGRLKLQVFKQPAEALELLERARSHPKATPEFQKVNAEMIAAAQAALGSGQQEPEAAWSAGTHASLAEPPLPSPSPETAIPKEPAESVPSAPTRRPLVAVSMRAVGIDARGLHLQGREGRTARLAWQQVARISVARIGTQEEANPTANLLILDLVIAGGPNPTKDAIRCIRLSTQDLAIPQLQGEPSPLRAFQRLVATILKATGAAPYPTREACLGIPEFPSFLDLTAYEADLSTRLVTLETSHQTEARIDPQ